VSGRILGSMSRWKKAASMFARAVELDPSNEPAYMALAAAWVAQNALVKGEKVYLALLARNKGSLPANYRVSELYLAQGKYARALAHIERVLEANPDHLRARVVKSRALRGMGKVKAATGALRAAFDRSGGDADVAEQLFQQLLDADERKHAIELIGILDRDDLVLATRISLGYLLLQVHARTEALAHANRLRARAPDNARVILLVAQSLAELRRRDQAIRLLATVPSSSPVFVPCRTLAAELLAKQGRFKEAMATLDQATATAPNNLDLTIARAQVHELQGQLPQARAILDAAVKKHPRSTEALYALGSFEDRAGQWRRSVTLMKRVIAMDPRNAEALNFLGYLLADHGQELRRAELLIRRAISISGTNGYMLDSLGWVLYRRGKVDRAEQVLLRASRLVPAEPEIYWHLAELYLSKRKRKRALQLLQRARSLHPERRLSTRINARIHALRSNK
jgi:tetratricopeptide (TPR) repeat protein